MSSYTSISVAQLSRLVGTPGAPALLDVRNYEDFNADARFIPGARRRNHKIAGARDEPFTGKSVVVIGQNGNKLSKGVAATLRFCGHNAEVLEGGFEEWRTAKHPLVHASKIPGFDAQGWTVWVTRARPKVDRIACPWLIRRFIDPGAAFLYVPAARVAGVAEHFSAVPFDVDDIFWSHRGELCTFDVMLAEFGLDTPSLQRSPI